MPKFLSERGGLDLTTVFVAGLSDRALVLVSTGEVVYLETDFAVPGIGFDFRVPCPVSRSSFRSEATVHSHP